ncbi:MAG TPA: NAD-dependent epimerase/dehydratase family protein [Dermatophilaceae bacterium]|nr:NAD-dependent epimerase/dehydratase family protein [Dermatophilaceae bacterium]
MTAPTTNLGHVLVTGGAGFIGCALSQVLADRADSWVVVDNLHPQVHPGGQRPNALHAAARLIVADVTDPSTFEALEQTPTTVIHLAAETGTGQSLHQASRHGLVNVVGTTRLTDWLSTRDSRPTHVLLTSSRAVYGEGAWRGSDGQLRYPGQRSHAMLESGEWDFSDSTAVPMRADLVAPAPTSVYGATKLAQEHVLAAWCQSEAVPLSVFRLQNVYGPGQSLTNPYTGIVTLFSRLAKAKEQIPVYEDGQIIRDFVFIDDIVSALAAGLQHPADTVRTLDVGSGAASSILELARLLSELHGAPEPRITGQFRDGDVRHALADITRTTAELGYRPGHDLRAGVLALQDWMDEEASR